MNQIVGYLLQMLLPALLADVLFLALRPLRRRRLAERGLVSGLWREWALALFFMFLAGLSFLTMLPRLRFDGMRPVFQLGAGGLNLIPGGSLHLLQFYLKNKLFVPFIVNFPGNILMFTPIGFFPALLWDRPRWHRSVLLSFFASLSIEFCQLFVARGTDVDDLILNTAGGLLGYWIFLLLQRFAPHFVSEFRCRKLEVSHGRKAGD